MNGHGRGRLNAVLGDDPETHPLAALEASAVLRSCRRGQKIYGPGDAADHWYRLVSGMAGMCAPLGDGRRRIVELLAPGDLFGFTPRGKHSLSAEALVTGTVVARYPRRSVEMMVAADPALGRRLLEIAFAGLARLQAHVVLIGGMSAQQRVGSFLVEIAERGPQGPSDTAVLAMSRYDIADYLGLSAETVSRALTEFKRRGSIALHDTHRVAILDRDDLGKRRPPRKA